MLVLRRSASVAARRTPFGNASARNTIKKLNVVSSSNYSNNFHGICFRSFATSTPPPPPPSDKDEKKDDANAVDEIAAKANEDLVSE